MLKFVIVYEENGMKYLVLLRFMRKFAHKINNMFNLNY